MNEKFIRTELLLGAKGLSRLKNSTVVVFGVGGVGSFVAEGLCRSGIGCLVLVDFDIVAESNLNRQIHADSTTVGRPKVTVMKERISRINEACEVFTHECFADESNAGELIKGASFVVDAVDSVAAKLAIIQAAHDADIPIISSMGMANKLYPEKIELADIYETSVCPLAKIIRTGLRKMNISSLPVCYTKEPPVITREMYVKSDNINKPLLGSVAFVPSVAGLVISGYVIRKLALDIKL